MADCTKCGTWNPDDKDFCWRCSTPLPKPEPQKPRRKTFAGLPVWMWVALAVLFVAMNFGSCLFIGGPPPG